MNNELTNMLSWGERLRDIGLSLGNQVDPRDYDIASNRALMHAELGYAPLTLREAFSEAAGQKLLDFAATQNYLSKYDSLSDIKDPILNLINGINGSSATDYFTAKGRMARKGIK